MKSDWKELELRDIVELVIDYRGKTPKKLGGDWCDSGYRALSAKNIKTGRIVHLDTIRYVDEDLYQKWMKTEIQRGDILITSEAPFGQIFFWNSDEKIVLSQRLFGVRINSKYDSRFIYYYMTTPEFQGELAGRATGTTVVGLRQPELMKCVVACPDIEKQKAIASILSSIDAKIELNTQINHNLEEQVKAIFKSWFVDFEPFGGVAPDNWKKGKLKNILSLQKRPIKAGDRKDLPYLPIDSIPMRTFAVTDVRPNSEAQSSLLLFDKDDILIGAMRVYFHRVIIAPFDGITRTTCFVLKPNDPAYLSFALLTCDLDSSIDFAQKTSKGSTMPYAVWDGGMGEIDILIPPLNIAMEFNSIVLPMLRKIQDSYREVYSLQKLRDILLPKLMSGEIDVSEVEI